MPNPIAVLPLNAVACGSTLARVGDELWAVVVVKATFALGPDRPAWPIAPHPLVEAMELAPFLPGAGVVLTRPPRTPWPQAGVAVYRDGHAVVQKQLVTAGDRLVDPRDPSRPATFGAIARAMPLLAAEVALPADVDFAGLHVAPLDQRATEPLRGDEWIVLDGLHPSFPRLQSQLPHARAEARAARTDRPGELHALELRADTLLIDPEAMTASVVWRGHAVVSTAEQASTFRVFVGVELPGAPVRWPTPPSRPEALPKPGSLRDTPSQPAADGPSSRRPFDGSWADPGDPPVTKDALALAMEESSTFNGPVSTRAGDALPFVRPTGAVAPNAAPSPKPTSAGAEQLGSTASFSLQSVLPKSALPFADAVHELADLQTTIDAPHTVKSLEGLPFWAPPDASAAPAKDALPFAKGPAPASITTPGDALPRLDKTGSFDETAQFSLASVLASDPLPFTRAAAPSPAVAQKPRPRIPTGTGELDRSQMVAHATPFVGGAPRNLPAVAPPLDVALPAPPPPGVVPTLPSIDPPTLVAKAPHLDPPEAAPMPEPEPTPEPEPAPARPSEASGTPSAPPLGTDLRSTLAARRRDRAPLRDLRLAGADLSGVDLSGVDLRDMDLEGARLGDANLSDARLQGARLIAADLSGANLSGADASGADLSRADLRRANLAGANFDGAKLTGTRGDDANAAGVQARRAKFLRAAWDGADFTGAGLDAADFSNASLIKARFVDARVTSSNFADAVATEAVFDRAHLADTVFNAANLGGASFAGVDATRARFENTKLEAARFDGAKLEAARFLRATAAEARFVDADLRGAVLQRIDARGADFSRANLRGAELRQAKLAGVTAEGADLQGVQAMLADISSGKLAKADLTGAILREANLAGADLAGAKLDSADLREANLLKADLTGASQQGAKLGGAKLSS